VQIPQRSPRHPACVLETVRPVYDGVTHLNIIRVSQQYRQNWSDPHPHDRSVYAGEPNDVVKQLWKQIHNASCQCVFVQVGNGRIFGLQVIKVFWG
jgi:hypothetical protein